MRVVIVGGTGNTGTALIDELEATAEVEQVVAVARRLAFPAPWHQKTTYIAADIRTDDLVAIFRDADAVVHLAWFFQPTHKPAVTWHNNVAGSARVFSAVSQAGVGVLVCASSVGAYSPGPGRVVAEDWPTHSLPVAGYGREKAYVERLLDAFEAEHPVVRVVRMRPAFLFTERAASEQRRIFAGPFVPNIVARRVPVLPFPRGLRFQALTTEDAAHAYRLALTRDVRGPFNLAATPIIEGSNLAEALGAKLVELPASLVRATLASAWHLRLAPAEPGLFDLVRQLPELDVTRAHATLAWSPRTSALDAVIQFVRGMAQGTGGRTRPLEPDGMRARARELLTGVGSRV